MEKPAPFDLNNAVRQWRDRLGRASSIPREDWPELEAHVRDSVIRLQAAGLSEEEAWIIAQKRIGSTDALGQEFAKVNSPGLARGITEFQFIGALLILFSLAALAFHIAEVSMQQLFDPIDRSGVWWEPGFTTVFGFAPPSLHDCMIACLAVATFLTGVILALSFRGRPKARQHHGKPSPV